MLGTGWLWLARALKVAGGVSLAFAVWTFLSPSLSWLLFFFLSLAAFSTAAMIKRRGVRAPAHSPETAGLGSGDVKALGDDFPPAPMFDREGQTPLERAFAEGEKGRKDAGPRRARLTHDER